MKAKQHSKEFLFELAGNIKITSQHFKLSYTETEAAIDAATRSPVRAMACYRAIANSLKVTKQ